MIKPLSLIHVYLYSLLSIILLLLFIFGFFWIREEINEFQRESEYLRKEYLDSRKELIKREVENAIRYIEYERSRAEARIESKETYIDDEERVIQKEILDSFEQFYFSKSGYLFGGDWNGISLFGPSKGQNMLEIGDGTGSDTIRNFIDTARSGGGYVEYELPDYNNDLDCMLKKISYIGSVEGWQWYIGSGMLLNEIEEVILQKQGELDRRIKDLVKRIVSLILLFLVFVFIVVFLLSRKIRKNLEIFRTFFETAATEATLINVDKFSFRESIIIAESANHMVIERQKVMGELLESEKRFFQIIEAANIPMAIGKGSNSEYLNKSFRKTFGYEIEDIPNMERMWELAYPDPVYREKVQKEWVEAIGETIGSTKPFRKQYCTVRCRNGKVKEVEIDFTPVGKRSLITFRDLTDQKKREAENALLEQKLLRAQKMEAIGLMAGGVAHDLNNILSGIVGYPDLIMMLLDEDSEIRPHVEAIKRSGLRAADVVADLLTIAKGVASTRKPCIINKIIDQYFESPEYEKLKPQMDNITLIRKYNKDILNISCSEVHIKKCIMNLIMNAVEAMENSGELTISTRNQYVDTPFSMGQYMEKGEYTVLSVKDTGHGIAEKDLDRIFDPFYTKKVMGMSGTGLGLSVVWNTVQDHNGGIIVNSTESGTSFELFFPVDRSIISENLQSTEVDDYIGSGESVLIIDDESLQQEIAAGMLAFLGYCTHSVSSGKEAIQWLKTNTVDILLLDMIMPSGISGFQTYKEILKIHPGQKAIIASGYSQNKYIESTLKLGAGRFIKKPYTMDLLGKAMKHELKKK